MSNEHVNPILRQALDAIAPKAESKPPYPFCCHPDKCIPTGRCERRVGGELWCCAD